jgi:hypothetical protein
VHPDAPFSPLDFSTVVRTGSRCACGHCISRCDYSSSGLHQLYRAYVVHPDVLSCRSTSCRPVALALAVRPVTASRDAITRRPDCTGSTAPMLCIRTRRLVARLLVDRSHWLSPCVRSLRLAARLLVVQIAPALLHLCRASGRAVSLLDFSSVGRTGSHRASGHCVLRCDYSSSRLHRLYYAYAAHPDAPSRRSTSRQSVALALAVCPVIPLCVVTTRLTAATDILRLRYAFGCFGTSRGLSRGLLSTTSPTSCVRVPRHVVRLVTRHVVDYFDYAACPGASAPRAAHRAARRRLLRLRHASGCLGTSRDSSRSSSLTTSLMPCSRVPRLVVGYFACAACPGASARRAARRTTRRAIPRQLRLRRASGCLGASRDSLRRSSSTTSPTQCVRLPRHVAWLVVDYFAYAVRPGASARRSAHCRLLCLHRASRCLGTSRGSSRRSSSTTSPTPRVWVPRHVTRIITRLVVDYSVRRDFVLRPHWLYFSHAVHRDYFSHGNTGSTSSTSLTAATSSSRRIASTIHLDQTSRERQSRTQQLVGINSD